MIISPTHLLRRTGLVAAAGALALAPALLPGLQTSAAGAPASVTERSSSTTMQLATVTRILSRPDRQGDVQARLSNGATVSMPARYASLGLRSAAPAGAMTPDGSVSGDCGTSYINLYEASNGHPVKMTTGFHVIHDAISYDWNAVITGPDYDYDYHSSGGLLFRSTWAGSHTSHKAYPRGIYDSEVFPTGSYAVLDDGGVCYSGGPTADRLL